MIDALLAFDRSLFLTLNSLHQSWLNPLMTFFSGQLVWLPVIALILYVAFQHLERKSFHFFVLFLLLTLIASDVTSSYIIKNIFDRLRPCREIDLKPLIYKFGQKCGGKFGFVSSHAANTFAILSFSILVFPKIKWLHYLWILPIIVSYSRIYLGVHYPGDVFGGILVGVFWASVLAGIFGKISTKAQA